MAAADHSYLSAAGTEAGRRAFPEVVRAHQSMVYSIACHCLRDRAAAEEIAQDVFLQLYRSLDKLESDAHIVHWLRRVATNRCIDYVRKRKLESGVDIAALPEPSTPGEQPDSLLNRKLQRLVSSLPAKQRAVVVLRYQEDLTPEEIAAVLALPIGTVKSHLQRSLAILREKMERGNKEST
jgi:RNA polymerase sigma-70 factor (ECF subfamily)